MQVSALGQHPSCHSLSYTITNPPTSLMLQSIFCMPPMAEKKNPHSSVSILTATAGDLHRLLNSSLNLVSKIISPCVSHTKLHKPFQNNLDRACSKALQKTPDHQPRRHKGPRRLRVPGLRPNFRATTEECFRAARVDGIIAIYMNLI